jgi:hypothetical protein
MLLTATRNQQLLLVGDPQSVAGPAHLVRTDRPARCPALLSSCSPAAGDRPDAAGRVTADDLIAVQLLSAQVPGEVAPDLLEGLLGDAVAHLPEIPVDVAIGAPAAADLLAEGAGRGGVAAAAGPGSHELGDDQQAAPAGARVRHRRPVAFGQLDPWWRWLEVRLWITGMPATAAVRGWSWCPAGPRAAAPVGEVEDPPSVAGARPEAQPGTLRVQATDEAGPARDGGCSVQPDRQAIVGEQPLGPVVPTEQSWFIPSLAAGTGVTVGDGSKQPPSLQQQHLRSPTLGADATRLTAEVAL